MSDIDKSAEEMWPQDRHQGADFERRERFCQDFDEGILWRCSSPLHESINGVEIYMYEREDHGPPHVHVLCDKETNGLIAIESLKVISTGKLPSGCLKVARKWIKEQRDRLMAFWREARKRQQIGNRP